MRSLCWWFCLIALFPAASRPARSVYQSTPLPLVFEPGQEQVSPHSVFVSRHAHFALALAPGEVVFRAASHSSPMRMRFVGARSGVRPEGRNLLPGKSSYYLSNDPRRWRVDVPQYAMVAYRGMYPGVDMVFYGSSNELEYDLILEPHADLNRVRLSFDDASRLFVEANGDLRIDSGAGTLRQKRPLIYQEDGGNRRELTGRYVVEGRQVHFAVDGYDPGQGLVIDPSVVFGTYLGGTGDDRPQGIAVDSAGNVYATGSTTSADFPGTPPLNAGRRSSEDVFVVKLDPTGQHLLYSVVLGGTGDDEAWAIAIDGLGQAHVTGNTRSSDFPTLKPYQATRKGQANAFVVKLDTTGGLVYSTYLGGSATDYGRAIALDSSGNAYIAGEADSPNFPVTSGASSHVPVGAEAFVTEFGAGGNLVFSTLIGGNGADSAAAIAIGRSGTIFVSGETQSTDLQVTAGAVQAKNAGLSDIWVAGINPTGSPNLVTALTYLGGSNYERLFGMCVDSADSVYLRGTTFSVDFPVTSGALQTIPADTWFAKLNSTLTTRQFASFLGSGQSGLIAVDAAGYLYMEDWIASTSPLLAAANVVSVPPPAGSTGGFSSGYLLQVKPDGSGIATAWVGALSNRVTAGGIGAVLLNAGSRNFYVAGTGGPVTAGALQSKPAGGIGGDVYLARVDLTPPLNPNPVLITGVTVPGGALGFAQNTWIEVHGYGLAPASAGANGITWDNAPEFASGRMPTQLQGVSVKVNGKPGYVYFVSPTQVNVLTPLDPSVGAVNIQLTNGSSISDPFNLNFQPVAPAFLVFGAGPYITAVHADGSLVGPASMSVPGYTFKPAKPGETILLFGTGFGLPTSALVDGSAQQSGSLPYHSVGLEIGHYNAEVQYAGVISPGLYQFNVVVPSSAADGDNPVAGIYSNNMIAGGRLIPVSR